MFNSRSFPQAAMVQAVALSNRVQDVLIAYLKYVAMFVAAMLLSVFVAGHSFAASTVMYASSAPSHVLVFQGGAHEIAYSAGNLIASTVTLDVDPTVIITAANDYIPMWMNILATPAGLMIAFAIVSLIVGAIVAAVTKARGMW